MFSYEIQRSYFGIGDKITQLNKHDFKSLSFVQLELGVSPHTSHFCTVPYCNLLRGKL